MFKLSVFLGQFLQLISNLSNFSRIIFFLLTIQYRPYPDVDQISEIVICKFIQRMIRLFASLIVILIQKA
ncbi:MAG: hypothetical protein CVU38_13565 [Chloroflexi bacterium HGW-Chloroflexi-1]|nr:MAG: hypothetical protein CVU38_13565 [Chloroflexi bacterium HGW-Chloroflexi-1]